MIVKLIRNFRKRNAIKKANEMHILTGYKYVVIWHKKKFLVLQKQQLKRKGFYGAYIQKHCIYITK